MVDSNNPFDLLKDELSIDDVSLFILYYIILDSNKSQCCS